MKVAFLFVVLAGVLCLSGCLQEDLQLEVISLEKDLAAKEGELKAAKERIAVLEKVATTSSPNQEQLVAGLKAKLAAAEGKLQQLSSSAGASGLAGIVSPEQLEANYETAVRKLRSEIESTPGYSIETFSIHKIEYPEQIKTPFRSKISVVLVSPTGERLTSTSPVSSDLKGNWSFPNLQQLLASRGGGEVPVSPPQTLTDVPVKPTQPDPSPVLEDSEGTKTIDIPVEVDTPRPSAPTVSPPSTPTVSPMPTDKPAITIDLPPVD